MVLDFLKSEKPDESLYAFSHKVYLTGFDERLGLENLKAEIKELLGPFKEMCQYKIKAKKNEAPYVIVSFETEELALKANKMYINHNKA